MIPTKDLSFLGNKQENILILSRHLGFLAFQRENACPKTFLALKTFSSIRRRFHPLSCGHGLKTTLFQNVTAENVRSETLPCAHSLTKTLIVYQTLKVYVA